MGKIFQTTMLVFLFVLVLFFIYQEDLVIKMELGTALIIASVSFCWDMLNSRIDSLEEKLGKKRKKND